MGLLTRCRLMSAAAKEPKKGGNCDVLGQPGMLLPSGRKAKARSLVPRLYPTTTSSSSQENGSTVATATVGCRLVGARQASSTLIVRGQSPGSSAVYGRFAAPSRACTLSTPLPPA